MILHAPAKINLCLHVTGQRADGYHHLESLVVFARAGDTLTFELARNDSLAFSGPFAGELAQDGRPNLVTRARDALRQFGQGNPCPPVVIGLKKDLPIASGIGGGSADAAATLKGLNKLWQLGFDNDRLAQIGLALGADVPMCIYDTALVARGVGEVIEPVAGLPSLHMLLVNPGKAVSTPAIFAALDSKNNAPLPPISDFSGSLSQFLDWLGTTRNDLERVAIFACPQIQTVLMSLRENGALLARMSGSGSTCFGLFESKKAMQVAKNRIYECKPEWWIAD